MRICVPVPCFFKNVPFEEAIRTIGSLGFDAAETYNWTNLDLDSVRAACQESGVELLSMCTTDFGLTTPENREHYLQCLKESCAAANKVGAKFLITQGGKDTGECRMKQHDSIISTLRAAAPILEDSGVTLMVEPLNTIVNHKDAYLWSSAEGFEIVRVVDSPNVKLIYDIYHQQIMEGNIIPSIVNNLDCIAHLHCAGHPGRHELQFGENDYKFIFKKVDESGYKGACGIEYQPLMDPIESLKEFRRLYLDA